MNGIKYIVFCMLGLLAVACGRKGEPENVITVTIEPYRFIVEAVAGDEWTVRTFLPSGTNPETADPTPSDVASLADSRAYMLVGGLGFERGWAARIAEMHPSLLMVDTSEGIERVNGDWHLWTSPDNMLLIARNVCDALCSMDSAGRDGYCSRLRQVERLLQTTDSLIADKLSAVGNKNFLIFHPSLTYFSNLYGLEQMAIEHEGKEPSVADIRRLVDSARLLGVKRVLVQQEFDRKNAQVIADELNAKVVEINPLSYNWQQEMLHIADCLCSD